MLRASRILAGSWLSSTASRDPQTSGSSADGDRLGELMTVDAGFARNPVPGGGPGSTPRVVVVVLLGELDLSTAPFARSQVRRGLAEQPERLMRRSTATS
jgi:hypothetical protein